VAATVVPRHILDVEDLEEFKSHKVVIRMAVFLRESVRYQGLQMCLLGRCLVSHGTCTRFVTYGLR